MMPRRRFTVLSNIDRYCAECDLRRLESEFLTSAGCEVSNRDQLFRHNGLMMILG